MRVADNNNKKCEKYNCNLEYSKQNHDIKKVTAKWCPACGSETGSHKAAIQLDNHEQ